MTRSFFLLSLLVVCTTALSAQQPLSTLVVDATTSTPLPYALLRFMDAPGGTYADDTGRLTANLPPKATAFIFSAIGYRGDTLTRSELGDTIRLAPVSYQTDVVTISADKRKRETVRYGKTAAPFPSNYGFASTPGTVVVRYLDGDWKRSGQLASATFRLDIDGKDCAAKVRVRVFSARQVGQSGAPDRDILRETVLLDVRPGKNKYTVDLSPYNIHYPPEGLCVGIEFLGHDTDCQRGKQGRGTVYVIGSGKDGPHRGWYRFNFRGQARWRTFMMLSDDRAVNPRFGATVWY